MAWLGVLLLLLVGHWILALLLALLIITFE